MESTGFSRDSVDAVKQDSKVLGIDRPHVQRYIQKLLNLILDGRIDTTDLISHRLPLEQAADG